MPEVLRARHDGAVGHDGAGGAWLVVVGEHTDLFDGLGPGRGEGRGGRGARGREGGKEAMGGRGVGGEKGDPLSLPPLIAHLSTSAARIASSYPLPSTPPLPLPSNHPPHHTKPHPGINENHPLLLQHVPGSPDSVLEGLWRHWLPILRESAAAKQLLGRLICVWVGVGRW
jgi:hypothetical protein